LHAVANTTNDDNRNQTAAIPCNDGPQPPTSHGISLDVRIAVTLPESAISLQKESHSLRKGVGGSNALKWGLAEMVLWSVCGWSLFSVFFAVQFCEPEKKMAGNLPTGPPTDNNIGGGVDGTGVGGAARWSKQH
jgi:hypothetical protein